jgi:hypothetical protein
MLLGNRALACALALVTTTLLSFTTTTGMKSGYSLCSCAPRHLLIPTQHPKYLFTLHVNFPPPSNFVFNFVLNLSSSPFSAIRSYAAPVAVR